MQHSTDESMNTMFKEHGDMVQNCVPILKKCDFTCRPDEQPWWMNLCDVRWQHTNVYCRMASWHVAFFRGHKSSLHCRLVSHRRVLAKSSAHTVGRWQRYFCRVKNNDRTPQHVSLIMMLFGSFSTIQKVEKQKNVVERKKKLESHSVATCWCLSCLNVFFFLLHECCLMELNQIKYEKPDSNTQQYHNATGIWAGTCRRCSSVFVFVFSFQGLKKEMAGIQHQKTSNVNNLPSQISRWSIVIVCSLVTLFSFMLERLNIWISQHQK